MTKILSIFLYSLFLLNVLAPASANDWAEWRGPSRDGVSNGLQRAMAWHGRPRMVGGLLRS